MDTETRKIADNITTCATGCVSDKPIIKLWKKDEPSTGSCEADTVVHDGWEEAA